jgi:hypothetical protein
MTVREGFALMMTTQLRCWSETGERPRIEDGESRIANRFEEKVGTVPQIDHDTKFTNL